MAFRCPGARLTTADTCLPLALGRNAGSLRRKSLLGSRNRPVFGCRGGERSRGLHGRRLPPRRRRPAAATASQEQLDPNQAQQQTPADAARLAPCRPRSSAGSGEQRGMMLVLMYCVLCSALCNALCGCPAARWSTPNSQQVQPPAVHWLGRTDEVPLLLHARWAAWCAADAGAHLQLPWLPGSQQGEL